MRRTGHGPFLVAPQERTDQVSSDRSPPAVPVRRMVLAALPWSLPVLASVAGLLSIDVPFDAIVRYAAYFAFCVALPGILLMRALWRSTGNWAEDVGLGAPVGIAFQLAGWALFTSLGWQKALIVWPLLVLLVFVLTPGLRRHWRIADPDPRPMAWSWGLAICLSLLALATTLGVMADHAPPPDGIAYYPDLLYHLSMVNELLRSVPPQLPQAAGEALDYHWFPNADMAGAADITGLSPIVVLYRLWLLPVVFVAVLAGAVLARQVSRVWWTGLLAGLAYVVPQLGFLVPAWPQVDLVGPISLLSPSESLAVMALAAAACFVIAALHQGGGTGVWVLALAMAVVGGGSKPTVLPILLGAVGLSSVFLLVKDRRIPWKSVLFGGLLVAIAVGTLLTVAGSTSGSNVQLLAIAKFQAGYRGVTGDESLAGTGGLLLPALTGDRLAVAGALVILAAFALAHAGLLAGFAAAGVRSVRRDPVAWLLVGGLTAAWLGLSFVDHPSASQYYFLRSCTPIAVAAVGWLIAVGLRGHSRRTTVRLSLAGLAAGTAIAVGVQLASAPGTDSRSAQLGLLARPLLVAVGLAVLTLVGWLVVRRRFELVGAGTAFGLLVVAGLPIGTTASEAWAAHDKPGSGHFTSPSWRLHPDELAAAEWLMANSGPDDVVLSGTYCPLPGRPRPGCDARGYLVSGVAGRRTLLDGWAYAQQALGTHGANGIKYFFQPSPWPDRVALTQQALTAPTRELLGRLRTQYGVRWIFADSHKGPVSAELDRLAVLRFRQAQVRIYELTEVPARP